MAHRPSLASEDPLDAFSIIYNSTEIPISKFKFALYSPRFRRISNFILAKSLVVTGDASLSTFRLFLAEVQGDRTDFADDVIYDLLDLSAEWETQAFTKRILESISHSAKYNELCAKLFARKEKWPNHELESILIQNINTAITFPAFKHLSLATLHRILRSPDADINPHLHVRFVLDMLELFHKDASILTESIDIRKLTPQEARELLSSPYLVTSFLSPSVPALTLSLIEQNTALSQRLQTTEASLEAVLHRLESLEENTGVARSDDQRLTRLSEEIQRVSESIESRISEADKKWHASLRKTNKTVNNLARKATETDEQLKSLSADQEAAARSLADLGKQTADLSAHVFDIRESVRVLKPINCHFSGRSFSGIISHLTSIVHDNVHVANVVKITASSSDHNEPYFVAEATWNDVWFSENKPDQWLMYDFGSHRVNVDHYTIKTHKYPTGTCHIKSWAVEASRDGRSWSELDRRCISLLNGPNRFQTFPCEKLGPPCRFIRLRQTALNARGDKVLALTHFELFGELLLSEEK
jgi:hypothetical protein